MISRRAIMQAIGMTTVSLPSAAAQLPALLASPSVAAGVTLYNNSQPIAATTLNSNPIWLTLSHLCEDYQREIDIKSQIRYRNQFDGDIQGMRSVSLVNKQRMQFEREMTTQYIMMKANRMRYG